MKCSTIQTTALASLLALTAGCASAGAPVRGTAKTAAPAVPCAVQAKELLVDLAQAPAREAFPLAAVAPARMVDQLRRTGLFVDVRPLEDPNELVLAEHEILIEGPGNMDADDVDLRQRTAFYQEEFEAIPPLAVQSAYFGRDGLGGEPAKWIVERTVQVSAQGGASAEAIANTAKQTVKNGWDVHFLANLQRSDVLAQKAQSLVAARGSRESTVARIEYLRGRQHALHHLASVQDSRVRELQGKLRKLENGELISHGVEQTFNQLNSVSRNPLAGFNQLNSFASNLQRKDNHQEREQVQREMAEAERMSMKYEALAERVGSMIEPLSESLYSLAAN